VIETVMIFAMGFLAATLVALLIIPAVNARAERLAKRRLEALFPMSISELTAEKDHQRAEFAVLQRRIERKAEEARSGKHADMEELGRRAVRIEALAARSPIAMGASPGSRAFLRRPANSSRARRASLPPPRRPWRRCARPSRRSTPAHRHTLDEFAATRARLDAANAALAETRTELTDVRERFQARETAFGDLDQLHGRIMGELDARRNRDLRPRNPPRDPDPACG
jgi:hypothetical protein